MVAHEEAVSLSKKAFFRELRSLLLVGALLIASTIYGIYGIIAGFWSGTEVIVMILCLLVSWSLCLASCWHCWRVRLAAQLYPVVREDFYERASGIYLWGYPLSEIIQKEVPRRLGNYYGSGFCHEFAAAIMYSLKDVKTARLCHGVDPEYGRHSWVEYRKYGIWWVADTAWVYQECVPWLRRVYRKNLDVKSDIICKYAEFWNGPFAGAIEILSNPEHRLQDSILTGFLPAFWPVFGYGMQMPDEDGAYRPIEGYKAMKPTRPAKQEALKNLQNREFIARFMEDPSFYAFDD